MTQTAASLSLREVAVRYGLNVKEIREDLLLAGCPDRTESRTVDKHIADLRKKIEYDILNPIHIIGVRGVGYKFIE